MHNRPTDRLEYFSDAVLAIAATLRATELPKTETETDRMISDYLSCMIDFYVANIWTGGER
jgi:uncharacterized membrane protein